MVIGIDYENMDDLLSIDDETKLKIVRREISNIVNLNDLLLDSLQYDGFYENAERYIYATRLIGIAAWHIRKMFPYN